MVFGVAISLIWIFSKNKSKSILYDIIKFQILLFLIEIPIVLFGVCTDGFLKFIISAPIFIFLCTIGYDIGKTIKLDVWGSATRGAAKFILPCVFFSILIEKLFPSIFSDSIAKYRDSGIYSGFFNEPSQLAFLVFPVLISLICSEIRKIRNFGWAALVLLIILSPSSSFIALAFLWIIFRFIYLNKFSNYLIAIFIALAMALIIGISGELQAIVNLLDRIDGVFINNLETSNISSLVYLQGFQDSIENLLRTNGFGLGANMMGCSPLPDIPARDALYIVDPEMQYLNNSDGSFIASKVVSEFGIFGIAFLIIILLTFIKKFFIFRKNEAIFSIRFMQISIFFALLEIIFIRSTGYFSGTLILIFTIIGSFRSSD
jgi:hypothetical protein